MIVSSRNLESILDCRSTLTSLHRSTDLHNLENELMTVMEPEDSIGRRKMSIESTEMIMDTPEM